MLNGMRFSKSIVNAVFVLYGSQTQINRPSLDDQSSENFFFTFGLLIIVRQIKLYIFTFFNYSIDLITGHLQKLAALFNFVSYMI